MTFASSLADSLQHIKSKKLDTLTVYGDSFAVHYHKLATSRRGLCKKMFRNCDKKYMWIYDVSLKNKTNKASYKISLRSGQNVISRLKQEESFL